MLRTESKDPGVAKAELCLQQSAAGKTKASHRLLKRHEVAPQPRVGPSCALPAPQKTKAPEGSLLYPSTGKSLLRILMQSGGEITLSRDPAKETSCSLAVPVCPRAHIQ